MSDQTVTFLRNYNRWRRGDEDLEQPCARKVGEMIDAACNCIERQQQALQEIAALDTSQDASPRQCAAVLLAMNALEQ